MAERGYGSGDRREGGVRDKTASTVTTQVEARHENTPLCGCGHHSSESWTHSWEVVRGGGCAKLDLALQSTLQTNGGVCNSVFRIPDSGARLYAHLTTTGGGRWSGSACPTSAHATLPFCSSPLLPPMPSTSLSISSFLCPAPALPPPPWSLRMIDFASEIRPCFTSHRGDSGTKAARATYGKGKRGGGGIDVYPRLS